MKVIICGGRTYRLSPSDYQWLTTLREAIPITEVVVGGARGVDTDAEYWAHQRGIPVTRFPADWDRYGKQAGPIRNQQMLDYLALEGGCIAFPGGRGTEDMVRRVKRHGLPLWQWRGAPVIEGVPS